MTNDFESSEREIVEFYNQRGREERVFDEIARKILVQWHMLSKEKDFIDVHLKRQKELQKSEEQIRQLESRMVN